MLVHVLGTLCKGSEVVLENAWFAIQTFPPSDQDPGWNGGFYLTEPGSEIEPGGPYLLFLNDGRRGEISIIDVQIGSHVPTTVRFVGCGPLG